MPADDKPMARPEEPAKEALVCLMVFQPHLAIPRYHKQTGARVKPEITQSGAAKGFEAPIGMPHIAAIQGFAYAMQFFLHQDRETAKHQVALLNGTLRRLEFYLDEDAEGRLILKSREPEEISRLDNPPGVR